MGVRAGVDRRRFLGLAGTGAGAVAGAGVLGCAGTAQARKPQPEPSASSGGPTAAAERPVYLGTYTSGTGAGAGIGLGTYDPETGRITSAGELEGVADPSFLTLSPSGGNLYAVNEREQGEVTALAVDEQGGLRVLGSRSTGGAAPCHLSVHPEGRHLFSANYTSGSVAVHPIGEDGALGERTDLVQHTGSGPDPRQEGPHAHMVLSDPAGEFVLAVDLGTDSVYTYRLDGGAGKLAPVSRAALRPGAGPRHLAFHPSGRFAYVANELDSTVVVCGYEPKNGKVTPGEPQPTVPGGAPGGERNYPAEVLVSADGRFVYVSNRGHDSVAVFAVESGGSALRLLDAPSSGGDYPRHISFDPAGGLLFAANQKSGSVAAFVVDRESGALKPSGEPFAAPVPVCVLPA